MKINYTASKGTKGPTNPLKGVRKATETATPLTTYAARATKAVIIQPKNTNQKKKSTIRKVLPAALLGFVLLVIISYFLKFPLTVSTFDMVTGKSVKALALHYPTYVISLDPALPSNFSTELQKALNDVSYEGKKRFSFEGSENVTQLAYSVTPSESDSILTTSYLIPVGHLYWIRDHVAKSNLENDQIFVEKGNKQAYEQILEAYLGKKPNITEVDDLYATLKGQENSIALVDVSKLNGGLKTLIYDNNYFFDKKPEGGIKYHLIARGKEQTAKDLIQFRASELIPESFDSEQILSLNMTGVTAITRNAGLKTAASKNGAYIAENIGDFLANADLTHTSNEISFADNCIPKGNTMSFCATNATLDALKKIGLDIVELTGNHNNDYGSSWNTSSINKYKELGWDYFGGGLNATDAAKILYKEVKGTKLAFVGYNYYDSTVGSPGALANNSRAGANSWSTEKITRDVAEARKNADVVIVTFQYQECWSYTDNYSVKESCYAPLGIPDQKKDFRFAIDAGADIVVGTQAHQPQTYEYYKGKVIYYGLGNLFFDQYQWLTTRQGLVLTHYFYKGQFMGTRITTTLYTNDLKTFVSTGNDRTVLLNYLKKVRNF